MFFRKIVILLIVFSFLPVILHATKSLSPQEEQAIYDFMDLRLQLTAENNLQNSLNKIDEYTTKLHHTTYSTYTPEAQLILDNFLILEKFAYLYYDDMNNPLLSKIILNQKEKNDLWFSRHTEEPINKWLYSSYADILSWSLQYLSKTELIKTGLKVKKCYEQALKFDPDMSYALFGLGQWYIQAPIIGGGSIKKGIKKLQRALDLSCSNSEVFNACLLLSQAYFENNKKDLANTFLQKAACILPHNNYISFIKILNKNNHSLFYYNSHKAKMDHDLDLK